MRFEDNGAKLHRGETLISSDPSFHMDSVPEALYEEVKMETDGEGKEYLNRLRESSRSVIDYEESPSRGQEFRMSDWLESEMKGSCLERAFLLHGFHLLADDDPDTGFEDLKPRIHVGYVDAGDSYGGHAWTSVEFEGERYISDPMLASDYLQRFEDPGFHYQEDTLIVD